jgi:hypothetical protein
VQSLLVFLAVATLSVLASNQRLLQAGRFFQLAQLTASGLIFLVLGAALGPHAAGLLTSGDLTLLRPVLALGLGLGGVLIGLNLDLRVLRRLPAPVYFAALSHSGLAFLAVAVPLTAVLFASTRLGVLGAIGAAALLGAAASVSSGHLAVLWYRSGRMERTRGLSVALLTMLDDLTGLAVLAIALVFGAAASPALGLGLVFLAMLLGLLCGALIAFLVRRAEGSELMAILLGGLALVAGAAAYLKVSALISGLFCGAALSLVGGKNVEQIYRQLARIERPAYLLLVFLIGAHVDPFNYVAWALVPAFVSLRFFGKLYGGRLAGHVSRGSLALPPRVGFALLAQGGVSLCVVTEYLLLVPRYSTELIFSVGVMAAVINEVLAARAFRHALEVPQRTPERA